MKLLSDNTILVEESKPPMPAGQLRSLKMDMLFYGVSCVLFWTVLLVQIPFISKYFGGINVIFYVPLVYGLFSNVSRLFLIYLQGRGDISAATRLSTFVWLGAAFTAAGMMSFPLVMWIIGTEHPSLGFAVCLTITSIVGTFNSFLVTGGFSLMSLVPDGSGQFFLLGLTATGIITWPFMMFLRFICDQFGLGDSTSFSVATISLVFTSLICLSTIPIYCLKTSKNVYIADQLNAPVVLLPKVGILPTLRTIWISALSLWMSRVITFCLYPGILGLWSPQTINVSVEVYRSFLIYLGPLSDTLGQLVFRYSGWFQKMGLRELVVITLLRGFVLIPLFVLSAFYDYSNSSFVSSDWFRGLLMFTFSCSMGINYSMGNAIAPRQVDTVQEKMNVGAILSFVASNGMFIGSLLGIGFKQLLVKV